MAKSVSKATATAVAGLFAVFCISPALPAQAPADLDRSGTASAELGIRVSRFWRDGKTMVQGVVLLPVNLARTSPVMRLTVRDQAGNELAHETWTDTSTVGTAADEAAIVTRPISFAVPSGAYDVKVTAKGAERADSAVVHVDGFRDRPIVSDVLLSRRIRRLMEGQTLASVEVQKGQFAIEHGPAPAIFPTDPRLHYYLELYAKDTVRVEYQIAPRSGGDPIFRTELAIEVGERGGVSAATIPVAGLPPGEYNLITTARAGTREEKRVSPFSMRSLSDVRVIASAPSTGSPEADVYTRYFAAAVKSDSAIMKIVDALTVAAPGDGVPASTKQLPANEQRRYLARYFSRIPDPRPATPAHELIEEYAARVEHVSREYDERDIGRSAFQTDRGRIYLRYGAPSRKQQLPNLSGTRAVEIWKYERSRSLKYAFIDETGFSNYRLIYTTDPQEQTLADWQERVGDKEAIFQIARF